MVKDIQYSVVKNDCKHAESEKTKWSRRKKQTKDIMKG